MLAFIHIRKTAGSTIDMILRQSFGAGHCRVRHGSRRAVSPVIAADELRRCRWIYWRMQSVSGHGIVPHSNLDLIDPKIRFYTFLRDPLARTASDYQFRVVRGGMETSFGEWIQTEVARNQQTKKIAGVEDADAAIEMLRRRVGFVGLVERFNQSLLLWRRWCGDPRLDIRYQSKNVSSNATLKKQLLDDPQTRQQLAAANREDQRLYEFVASSIFPRQIHEYGQTLAADVQDFEAANVPRPVLPRQLFSMLLRELLYKPLAPVLRNNENPSPTPRKLAA